MAGADAGTARVLPGARGRRDDASMADRGVEGVGSAGSASSDRRGRRAMAHQCGPRGPWWLPRWRAVLGSCALVGTGDGWVGGAEWGGERETECASIDAAVG